MITTLQQSGLYRVLRRIQPHVAILIPEGTPTRLGLLLDLETPGLDPLQHEIIEMAMLPFTYGLSGTLDAVGEPFSQLRHL
jgi:DNA polymerase-3 subunit epsilon